jgi:hypothetical protein
MTRIMYLQCNLQFSWLSYTYFPKLVNTTKPEQTLKGSQSKQKCYQKAKSKGRVQIQNGIFNVEFNQGKFQICQITLRTVDFYCKSS